ncbi:phosphotransferase-like protein [Bacillus sp. NEB1478]|uniref:chloramphenicol phosphotransferase CPT family protein n=1 Tax=Bacillus sp. NEB1478 TaxID=3073816 RepID=UPI002872EF80|nr:AAA family ATPase [Bacillus sp. NEB1478]WNB90887.1 AAA family ATPase [Bacillus sp. NEB1478]
MSKGRIILLNGVSSSGKSTLSKKLVEKLPDYFHLSIDDFDRVIEMMENRDQNKLIPVPTEYFFHRTVAMFSDKGINLVVDQVMHDQFSLEDCLETLNEYPVFIVGVHCPLEELERREGVRGDRTIGQAKNQLKFVHQQNERYDINVDTYHDGIEACVDKIVERLAIVN